MTTNVYIADATPGAQQFPDLVKPWTDAIKIGPRESFVWISWTGLRDTSRWQCVVRKRPFIVTLYARSNGGYLNSFEKATSATLDGALKAAMKVARYRDAVMAKHAAATAAATPNISKRERNHETSRETRRSA